MNEQLVMQRAVEAKRAGRYDEARTLYHSVIEAIPQCDPAYKGLAKVEIAAGRYEDAIRATLMKIDLGIFFTSQLPYQELAFIRRQAIQNMTDPQFGPEVRFGRTVIPAGETYRRCLAETKVGDVALLAWAEPDLYFYLGHCLVRMFPAAFDHYGLSEEVMRNFEKAVSGIPSGTDARDLEIAPVFYISGFWLAVSNISAPISSIEPSMLKARFGRQLDFMGLSSFENVLQLSDAIDSKTGVSSSMNAASEGRVEDLRALHDVGARFNNQDNDGWTPLFYAVAKNQLECVRYLVSIGVDLNLQARDGWTALMVAIDHNLQEIVQLLLGAGARSDLFGNVGQIAVCTIGIAARHVGLLKMLLDAGADPNIAHPTTGHTPAFLWQYLKGGPDGLRLLRRYGADFNIKDRIAGQTPIMVNVGDANLVAAFLECGADPYLRDNDGESAFDYAAKPGADPLSLVVLNRQR